MKSSNVWVCPQNVISRAVQNTTNHGRLATVPAVFSKYIVSRTLNLLRIVVQRLFGVLQAMSSSADRSSDGEVEEAVVNEHDDEEPEN